jgi:glycosyltransferase involved in cell wall biosynthesis
MNKKIAFFLPPLGDGGLERTVLKLADLMAGTGSRVDLITVKAGGPLLGKVHHDVTVVDLNARRALSSLPGLIRYLRQQRPDALICAQYYTNVIAVWAKALAGVSTKVILTERLATSCDLAYSGKLKDKLLPVLMRRAYVKADAIVAISKGAAEDLSSLLKIPSDKIKTIYNPAFDDKIVEEAAEPVDHPWFADKQRPVILGAGRLTGQKDFATLLRAFALVRKRIDARLLILGEGERRGELENLAKHLGISQDVALPGFVDNPYKYMAKATLFVLSSIYEGLGNVTVEALAAGTCAIATDCPSGPSEILPQCALVPVGDYAAMAEKISDLLRDPQQALQILEESRHNLDKFRPETCLRNYMELIEEND